MADLYDVDSDSYIDPRSFSCQYRLFLAKGAFRKEPGGILKKGRGKRG
jgi:hypothetical protein